jgi:hypothetical protein
VGDLKSGGAYLEDGTLKDSFAETVLPAIGDLQRVLGRFARDARQDLNLSLNFTVATHSDGGSDPVQAEFYCVNEFGDACDLLIEPVIAFGGSCQPGEGGTTCKLPPPLLD